MRLTPNRVGKAERSHRPRAVLLHIMPGETAAKARAAYERQHGKIKKDADVIVIRHTFRSRL